MLDFENSGITKGRPGRAQALPNACCAMPLKIDTLIEQSKFNKQSNTLLKLSADQIVPYQLIKCREWVAAAGIQ